MKNLIQIVILLELTIWTKGQSQSVDTVAITELQTRNGNLVYQIGTETPFSGIGIERYQSGKKKSETNYVKGVRVGYSATWFENGLKEFEGNTVNGKLHGIGTIWYKNGQKKDAYFLVAGEVVSMQSWDESGKEIVRLSDLEQKDGLLQKVGSPNPFSGICTEWHSDGTLKSQVPVINGKKEGLYTEWWLGGKKSKEKTFVNGKEEGRETWWHMNGAVWSESTNVHGQVHGPYISYHNNGTKSAEANYVYGQANGLSVSWYENGQKEEEKTFVNDRLDGRYTKWWPNGKKKLEFNASYGRQENRKEWDEAGKKLKY